MKSDEIEFPIPAKKRPKLSGMDFYTKVLGSPKLVVAPMVDQSELAWRLLCRRHGAQLCYTPMYHSSIFVQDSKYRQQALQSCPEDRPLIIQFCGNDPAIMLEAALLAQDHCDAIDINLGCPQAIAKRGHYGAFLQDEWDLLYNIVNTLHKKLDVPVTCKIRVFDDKNKSIKYAQMLETAGCQLLTVHGRTREQKGPLTGLADWSYIKAIRDNVQIPMFANGNILSMEDIDRCLLETGVNGVMTAEGNLHNPAIFESIIPKSWDIANEYLDIVEQWPCPTSYIRGHLFKIFHHLLNLSTNADLRESMAISHKVNEFRKVVIKLEEQFLPYHLGFKIFQYNNSNAEYNQNNNENKLIPNYNLLIPPWLCHSYIRMEPEKHKEIIAEKLRLAEDPNTIKKEFYDCDGHKISRKRMKHLRRVNRRPNKLLQPMKCGKHERYLDLCESINCNNPMGIKCLYKCCRICCRRKTIVEMIECPGHKFFLKKTHIAQQLVYDSINFRNNELENVINDIEMEK